MRKFFRAFRLLPVVFLLAGLAACVMSGPQKTLNAAADALSRNDSAAFLAQMDTSAFAANQIKNMTREDQALSTLDSMGRMLGLGGMEDLLGSVMDMEARLRKEYTRGVSTGEMMAQCRAAQSPDCPWTPESLRNAKVTELGPDAAVAQVTTPARMTSWLALRKVGDRWLVVGQAVMENTAREFAVPRAVAPAPGSNAPKKKAPEAPKPAPLEKPAPAPDNRADNEGVVKI